METLTNCLAELDELDAAVAAAHVDTALHALATQFGAGRNASNPD
jgi:hypothetical protein